MVQLSIREKTFRTTKAVNFISQVISREKSDIVIDNSTENYSVFNAKYYNTKTEVSFEFIVGQISGIWKIFN
jgi:hypothetical protein